MQTVCVKFEENMLKDVEKAMKKNRYATKTEFIREAVRTKLTDIEKREAIIALKKLSGISTRKTTDKQLHEARERAVLELEQEFKQSRN